MAAPLDDATPAGSSTSSAPATATSTVSGRELIVDARGVHAWYGSSHVLHGVDLQIARGQTVGLLGRNGMGKSTLIRSLLGHVLSAAAAHLAWTIYASQQSQPDADAHMAL